MRDELKKLYSLALNKLTRKDLSVCQMKNYLNEKSDNVQVIDEVINLLVERKFLDDQRLIYEVVLRLRAKGYGKHRIEKSLESYHFDSKLVDTYVDDVAEKSLSDLSQLIKSIDVRVYHGSKKQVIKKIQDKFIRKGFSMSQVTSSVTDDIIDYDEFDSCKVDANKLYKNTADEYLIKNKLYQKGYQNSTIQKVLEGRRANEDK